MRLLAIVGMPGAGKSEASQFFREKGYPVLRFGDATDVGLKALGLTKNETNERMYREKIRQELGMAAMAIKIEPRIREISHEQLIILDGMMSWEEFIFLRDKFPEIKILHIYASPVIRYKRLQVRNVRSLAEEEAKSRDIAEIENLNKGGPIAIADFMVNNDGDKQGLFKELELTLKNI